MLTQNTINTLAKLAKVKPEDLKAAIDDTAEKDLAVDDKITTLTEEEVTTLKNNEYKKGKDSGVEMAVKSTKEKLGLEFQGKTIDGLVEAAQKKAVEDAKIPANEKVTELQNTVTKLQTTITQQDQQLTEKEKTVQEVKLTGDLYKHIPAGASLGNDEILGLMKLNGYSFEIKEGKTVVSLNGAPVADKLSNAIPVGEVITGFLKDKKLIDDEGQDPPGGRGNDPKPPVKFTKLSELKAKFTAEKKSLLGQEFNDAVMKAKAENKDFDLNA